MESVKKYGEGNVDLLQKQIMVLSAKIDALHQIVEQLNNKLTQAIADGKLFVPPQETTVQSAYPAYSSPNVDRSMEHKDILQDSAPGDSRGRSGEKQLSPEVQIQRLTAQLTAAYNQIAALEERLLARRVQ